MLVSRNQTFILLFLFALFSQGEAGSPGPQGTPGIKVTLSFFIKCPSVTSMAAHSEPERDFVEHTIRQHIGVDCKDQQIKFISRASEA